MSDFYYSSDDLDRLAGLREEAGGWRDGPRYTLEELQKLVQEVRMLRAKLSAVKNGRARCLVEGQGLSVVGGVSYLRCVFLGVEYLLTEEDLEPG